ncbi:dihydroorotate dehydrogenase electron transfer subunit [Oceanobacillus kimchii]|uniref:dihydroorotate dehydrogenase electron transfer subunit n=1 Tax=Oceanobacillus kimchii TaxID=746691 RepID=UPI0003497155|nr:dihydroorotate dehydrogenase electron transfer subunit [Oceanobacillus kimchii]
MRKRETMSVLSVTQIATDTFEMIAENSRISEQAKPGQFVHIYIPGHTLRRPISIAAVDPSTASVSLVFKAIGEGTKQLSNYQSGMQIDVFGPNGNGFSIDISEDERVLLIGGGVGVPPMYHLAKRLSEETSIDIVSVLGFQTKNAVFYEEEFNRIGETYIVTDDGSYGTHGVVTDIVGQFKDRTQYFSCGPLPMLRAVKSKLSHIPGKVSLEERMGCGVGACMACVLPTVDNHYKKICSEGPVFVAEEVVL